MQASMYKPPGKSQMLLLLQVSILITQSVSFPTKIEDVPDSSIKCGECPCVNPCSPQPPPPPPTEYSGPPPPRFVYVTEVAPPPPPRFVFTTTEPPGNLYEPDPIDWKIYSNASIVSVKIAMVLSILVISALQLW